mgnify:CR=1 FL=1
MRRSLGIADDEIAVLYAPTWRENRTEMVMFLELERLMADLGPGYRLLLRGHSRTKKFGADVLLPGVLDVTSYPNIADLYLAADDGVHAIAGSLHLDGLGLLLVAGLVGKRPPLPGPLDDSLPVALRAEVGFTHLPASDAAAIAPGDVVLMDAFFATADRALWLSRDGTAGVHVQWPAPSDATSPPRLTVIQPWTETMPASPDTSPAETAALDSVPVRLSFDLGEVSLTLAQLRALQPGQTLDLGHPLAGAVRIRANGALVGEGDLVEIDGQIGVSVRHLFPASR